MSAIHTPTTPVGSCSGKSCSMRESLRLAAAIALAWGMLLLLLTTDAKADSGPQPPTNDVDYDYRAHGQRTAAFDWGDASILAGLLGEKRLETTARRAHTWIESPRACDEFLLGAESPVVTLNNNNLSYMKYRFSSPARETIQNVESAFAHTADPASLVVFPTATAVEVHWQPDRRTDYEQYVGQNVVLAYRVYRNGVPIPGSFEIPPSEPEPWNYHFKYVDTPPAPGTYTYSVKSVIDSQDVDYSREVAVGYPYAGPPQDRYWLEKIRIAVTPHYDPGDPSKVVSYTASAVASLAVRWGGSSRPIRASVYKPSHKYVNTAADVQVELSAVVRGSESLYTYASSDETFGAELHAGYAIGFSAWTGTVWEPLFGGMLFTTNPNNRQRNRSFPEYIMDRSHPAWHAAWAAESEALLQQVSGSNPPATYTGIFGDSADPSIDWAFTVGPWDFNTGALMTQQTYQGSLLDMLSYAHAWLSQRGRALYVNGIADSWFATPVPWEQHVDGALREHFTLVPGATWWENYLGSKYAQQLDLYRQAAARLAPASKPVIALAEADNDSTEARLFALASYLLVAGTNTQISARAVSYEVDGQDQDDKSVAYFPEFQVDLGEPGNDLGPFPESCLAGDAEGCDLAIASNPFLVREFQKGTVVVNYRDFTNWTVGSPKLPPAAVPADRAGTRLPWTVPGTMYRLCVDNKTLIEGGRIWTEEVSGVIEMSGRTPAILLNDPIRSPDVDPDAIYPLFSVTGAASTLAVHASHWDGTRLWVQCDGRVLGLTESAIPLRDDGTGADLVADDGVYTSEALSIAAAEGTYSVPVYARGEDGISVHASVNVQVIGAPVASLQVAPPDNDNYGLTYAGNPYSSLVIDYNKDTKQDLLVTTRGGWAYLFRRDNDASATFPSYDDRTIIDWSTLPPVGCRGACAADYDNDGYVDVFLAHRVTPKLYKNDGTTSYSNAFVDQTASAGIGTMAAHSWCGAWGDYDADGYIDLFVGRAETLPGHGSNPYADIGDPLTGVLLRNTGQASGTFVDRSVILGTVEDRTARATTATWGYVDDNYRLDLLVGQAISPPPAPNPRELEVTQNVGATKLFIQQPDTTFANQWGERTGYSAPPWMSALQLADMDGDEDEDLLGAGSGGAYVFWNADSDGHFTRGFLPYWQSARGCAAVDFDLDGRKDILALPDSTGTAALALYWNQPSASGPVLADVAPFMGIAGCGSGGVDGASVMDFNRDGDLDIYLGKPLSTNQFLVQNKQAGGSVDTPAHSWVGVQLVGGGAGDNLAAIGARVSISADDVYQYQRVDGGSGRGGQEPGILIFGLGSYTGSTVNADITWPNGSLQFAQLIVGQINQVLDAGRDPAIQPASLSATSEPWPGNGVTHVFTWVTRHPTVPALDKVKIKCTYSPASPCYLGAAELWLAPGMPGVSVTVQERDGWYRHDLRWDRECVAGCAYWYQVYCSSLVQQVQSPAGTTFKKLSVPVCIGEDDPNQQ